MLVTMNREPQSTSYLFVSVFVTLSLIFGGYIYLEGQSINKIYDNILAAPTTTNVSSVTFPDSTTPFMIPNWSLFAHGNIWSLTSRSEALPAGFTAKHIISTSAPHAND